MFTDTTDTLDPKEKPIKDNYIGFKNTQNNAPKKRIVFPFIEAGLGHIMPMRAALDSFKAKYGDRCEIIEDYFLREEGNDLLNEFADKKIAEVLKVNKSKAFGTIQHAAMNVIGCTLTTKFLHKAYWKKYYEAGIKRLVAYNADLIFHTYFSTLYYHAEAKAKGLTKAKCVTFCPDPIVGVQWDRRGDLMLLSSSRGKDIIAKKYKKTKCRTGYVPFLLRTSIADYTKTRSEYKQMLDISSDKFTILLADGAYGAAKLKDTVLNLLKSDYPIAIIAVCGKNEGLYNEFLKLEVPSHIDFRPFGFTDKMLQLAATCDLFIGRSAASTIAEPAYFGAPAIITRTSTGPEKWICDYHVKVAKGALKITSAKNAAKKAIQFAKNPSTMQNLAYGTAIAHRHDGPQLIADILWDELNK